MLAMVLIAALVIEVFITLADFIEEDMSRKLPATERVNHTLLAINYGAILMLAAPVLIGWAGERTAVKLVSHGYWSVLMAFAAFGAVIFGLRDLFAALRPEPAATPPEDLVERAAGTADGARHRRHRLHRPPARAGAGDRRPPGDRACAQP